MNINGGPSITGLQHMATRAQEARKSAGLVEPKAKDILTSSTVTVTPYSGNNVSAPGENLPPSTATEQPRQKPGHATGLERAMERLQQNAIKNPEVAGLQHALEMLQRNQERGGTVDVQV